MARAPGTLAGPRNPLGNEQFELRLQWLTLGALESDLTPEVSVSLAPRASRGWGEPGWGPGGQGNQGRGCRAEQGKHAGREDPDGHLKGQSRL